MAAGKAATNFFWVVLFEDGLSVVPDTWVLPGNKASLFPNTKQQAKIEKAVKKRFEPKEDWKIWKILRTFGKYENYEEAVRKSKTAEITSDVTSEEERNPELSNQDLPTPRASRGRHTKDSQNGSQERVRNREQSSSSSSSSRASVDSSTDISEPELTIIDLARNGGNKGRRADRPRSPNETETGDPVTRAPLNNAARVNLKPHAPPNGTAKGNPKSRAPPNDAATEIPRPYAPSNDVAKGNPKPLAALNGTAKADPKPNRCCDCKDFKLSEARWLRLEYDIRMIRKRMQSMLEKFDELPIAMTQRENRIVEISQLTTFDEAFPMKTEEEVDHLNTMLTEDHEKAEYLEKFFKTVGGSGHVEAIRRCLVRTFTDNLATLYSWEGRRGKTKLDQMKILKVLFKTLLTTCSALLKMSYRIAYEHKGLL